LKKSASLASRGVLEGRGGLGFLKMSLESRVFALRKIWIFCAAVCGVALLASLGIQGLSLDTPLAVAKEKEVSGSDGELV